MQKTELKNTGEEVDISFNKILQSIKINAKYLLRKWWILTIAFVIGGGLGWGYCFLKGTTYTANCTFTVQGQSASSSLLSSALSLASSLGISSKSGGPSSYDNNFFANLMKSRRIVKETLLQEDTIFKKKDILVNHYINIYELDEDWEGLSYEGFRFKNESLKKLTRLEDSILTTIYDLIIDENLSVDFNVDNPFNSAKFVSSNYELSKHFLKKLLNNTSSYYLREMYSLNTNNFSLAEKRVDSLANAIRDLDVKVARLKDNSNNMVRQSGYVDLNAAIRDQSLLNIQYSSAVNNFEIAKVSLLSQTPILDIIDDPNFSTDTNVPMVILVSIASGIFVFFLIAIGLIVFRFIKSTAELDVV